MVYQTSHTGVIHDHGVTASSYGSQDYYPRHGVSTPTLRPQSPSPTATYKPSSYQLYSTSSRPEQQYSSSSSRLILREMLSSRDDYTTPTRDRDRDTPSFMRHTNASVTKSRPTTVYEPPLTSTPAYERRIARALDFTTAPPVKEAISPCQRQNTAQRSHFIQPQTPEDQGKYTIVFDLDETLVYAREGPVKMRPGAQRVLQNLSGRAEVVLWTAGERSYAMNALRSIDKSGAVKHVVARDGRWCRGFTGGTKDLRNLGRDLSRTLIVENTAECVRANSDCAILVPDFNGGADTVLSYLDNVLNDLLQSGQTVQQFLTSSPSLTPARCRTPAGEAVNAFGVKGFTPTDAVAATTATASYSQTFAYTVAH